MSAVPDTWTALTDAIDSEIEAGLPDLLAAIRIPSVSAAGSRLRESADYLAALLARDGWDSTVLERADNPVVFAEIGPPDAEASVLIYGHHDVQPAEPLEAWTTPPFEPVIRDGRIFGRGASDNKGQFFCHIFAIRALRRLMGELPLNLKLILDGREESGSGGLQEALALVRPRLKADFAFTADGPVQFSGVPRLTFGFRGMLALRLTVREATTNLHSGIWGNLAPNAALRLCQILGGIKGVDGRVMVEGFYDGAVPPDEAERAALDAIPYDAEDAAASIGVQSLEGPTDVPPMERVMFLPSFTITGLSAGYAGPGFQASIPCEAVAQIDIRFVAGQDPERIYGALKTHLAKTAPDARLEWIKTQKPSRTRLDPRLTSLVARAVEIGFGQAPVLHPRSGGSSPDHLFTDWLGIPSINAYYANPDQRGHAPDENLRLENLRAGASATAALLMQLME